MPISAGKKIEPLPPYQPVWAVQYLEYPDVFHAAQKLIERFPAEIESIPLDQGAYRIRIDLPNQEGNGTIVLERGQLLVHDERAKAVWVMWYDQTGIFTISSYNLAPGPELPGIL